MSNEHRALIESIHNLTGMTIEQDKVYLIETRLADIMKEFGLTDYNQVAERINKGLDTEFNSRVIEKITTHETRFFRDESIFDALAVQIVPEWLERRGVTRGNVGANRLEIWSAGCSTGQEAYSISMMLQERLPDVARSTFITATDISNETIEKAKKARYSKFEVERGVPPQLLSKYFTPDGDGYLLQDQIKSRVSFRALNLVEDSYPGPFDLIFCRNVAIYFTETHRKALYVKLRQSLKKDGILILGSAESLSGYLTDYILREFGLARYYELNASQVTIFKPTT